MIRARIRALVDEAIERVMQKSAYRDPYRIRVNGRWVHVDDYDRVVGRYQED